MELYQVWDHLLDERNDRSWWPLPSDNYDSIALMTAAVSLSGRMRHCKNEHDLKGAVEVTMDMVADGRLERWSWAQESVKVTHDMDDWCREHDPDDDELQRIEAERN